MKGYKERIKKTTVDLKNGVITIEETHRQPAIFALVGLVVPVLGAALRFLFS